MALQVSFQRSLSCITNMIPIIAVKEYFFVNRNVDLFIFVGSTGTRGFYLNVKPADLKT